MGSCLVHDAVGRKDRSRFVTQRGELDRCWAEADIASGMSGSEDFVSANEGSQAGDRVRLELGGEGVKTVGLAEREPAFQIQPRIVVVLGLMMVLWADKRRLLLCRA